jgi:hypothetical protein
MSAYLFKAKHAVYNAAQPKEGEPVSIFLKPNALVAPGDLAIICTKEKHDAPLSPKACFFITNKQMEESPHHTVVIEKVDTSKKASHLIKHTGGYVEWIHLTGSSTKVLYMNGSEIASDILGSAQIEGVTAQIIRTKYTMSLASDNCMLIGEGESMFGSDSSLQDIVKNKEYVAQLTAIIKKRTGREMDINTSIESQRVPTSPRHKRETDSDVQEQASKKISPSIDAPTPPESTTSPPSPINAPPNIKHLIKHFAEVAQMVKEMDDEHSDRLSKVEMEVARIRSILQQHSLITSHLSMSSPSTGTTSVVNASTTKKKTKGANSQKSSRSSFTVSDIHIGELVAVRADRSVTPDAYYWMARVVNVGKSTIRVKWFEPCEFASNWLLFDNKEDEVEVGTIFAKNFEVTLKPVKHPSGHYVDIYKPVNDLSKLDTYK